MSILDFISSTPFIGKIVFIGGTNLRLIKGIDRFSEDLDFDCNDFSREEFMAMTDSVLLFLKRSGFRAEICDTENERKMVNIKGCGFYFPFPMPSDEVLCSMKISAMLFRKKGRDFYDAMFLLSQSPPDYLFLTERQGIHNLQELKQAASEAINSVDLNHKKRDFEHLLLALLI